MLPLKVPGVLALLLGPLSPSQEVNPIWGCASAAAVLKDYRPGCRGFPDLGHNIWYKRSSLHDP
jgi:hypothetical protein